MPQNAKVTAFTVSELLRENQQGVKLLSTQIMVKIASCAACRDLGTFDLAMFVTFVCISYFALQICVNLTREKFLVSREKVADKVCIFS